MTRTHGALLLGLLMAAWSGLAGGARADESAASGPLYFTSPQDAVPIITDALRSEDWATLARYHDLSGSRWRREELEDGSFFLRAERPESAHPGGSWKYRHPFAPGRMRLPRGELPGGRSATSGSPSDEPLKPRCPQRNGSGKYAPRRTP